MQTHLQRLQHMHWENMGLVESQPSGSLSWLIIILVIIAMFRLCIIILLFLLLCIILIIIFTGLQRSLICIICIIMSILPFIIRLFYLVLFTIDIIVFRRLCLCEEDSYNALSEYWMYDITYHMTSAFLHPSHHNLNNPLQLL